MGSDDVGPFAHSGGDGLWLGDEFAPGVTSGVDDVVIGFEDELREPVAAQELPDVFDGVQRRRAGRQEDRGDVARHV